jgi:hypothetical protein
MIRIDRLEQDKKRHGTVMRWFGAALAATLVEAIVGYLRRP